MQVPFGCLSIKGLKTIHHFTESTNEKQQAYLPVNSFSIANSQILPYRSVSAAVSEWGDHKANSHNTKRNSAFKTYTGKFHMCLNEMLHFILPAIYKLEFSFGFSDHDSTLNTDTMAHSQLLHSVVLYG